VRLRVQPEESAVDHPKPFEKKIGAGDALEMATVKGAALTGVDCSSLK